LGFLSFMPSQQVVFQVAHAISGRIRLKIPRLRTDLDFRYRVKVLMEAVQGVDPPGDRLAVKFDNDLTLYTTATLTLYQQEQVEEYSLWLFDKPGEL